MSDNVIPFEKSKPVVPIGVVEAQLLGGMLALGDPTLLDLLGTDNAFSDPKANTCWMIAKFLADHLKPVNADTVFSLGFHRKFLDNTDAAWLAGLESSNTLTSETFAIIAGEFRRSALGRQLAVGLRPTLQDLASGNFVTSKALAELEAAVNALVRSDTRGRTAAADVLELEEKWEKREETGESPIVSSRIKLLDEAIGGGFPPKFGVIMGDPGVGKNMVLAGMILAQLEAEPSLQIGLFALEDGSRWLLKRWVALRLGIPLADVGVKKRTPEQMELLGHLMPYFHKLLERVHTYNFRKINAREMLLTSRVWIHQHGVREILFDNLTHLDIKAPMAAFGGGNRWQPRGNEKRNEAVADAVDSFAELADIKEIPIICLAHTIRPDGDKAPRPPRLSEAADSAGIERNARFAAGLWRTVARELRMTILKNTEGPGTAQTIELERIIEAATIEPSGGRLVNLEQEARDERKSKEAEKTALIAERRKAALQAREAEKADAAAKKNPKPSTPAEPIVPQMTLLDGGKPEAPKS